MEEQAGKGLAEGLILGGGAMDLLQEGCRDRWSRLLHAMHCWPVMLCNDWHPAIGRLLVSNSLAVAVTPPIFPGNY